MRGILLLGPKNIYKTNQNSDKLCQNKNNQVKHYNILILCVTNFEWCVLCYWNCICTHCDLRSRCGNTTCFTVTTVQPFKLLVASCSGRAVRSWRSCHLLTNPATGGAIRRMEYGVCK